MADIKHPHQKVISNMEDIYPMISLINDSKINYIKENLSIHLHSTQVKLLKDVYKHSKPHHRRVRVSQYASLQKTPEKMDKHFDLHKNLYIRKYEKLAKKGLVTVDTECEDLPYDVVLTDKGKEVLEEMNQLEIQWQEIVLNDVEDPEKLLELLKQVTQNALPINYNHKKQQKFVF